MAAGWGSNAAGQLAALADLGPVIAVSASGNHSLALKRDRTVAAHLFRRPECEVVSGKA